MNASAADTKPSDVVVMADNAEFSMNLFYLVSVWFDEVVERGVGNGT